jgi:peptidyl-tRNA hydrolase
MIKQVIIWRKDLNVRKGKLAAQIAHASMKVFFDKMIISTSGLYRYTEGNTLHVVEYDKSCKSECLSKGDTINEICN